MSYNLFNMRLGHLFLFSKEIIPALTDQDVQYFRSRVGISKGANYSCTGKINVLMSNPPLIKVVQKTAYYHVKPECELKKISCNVTTLKRAIFHKGPTNSLYRK